MNKVMLIGRLTKEPEMRKLASGKTVTTFTVATHDYRGAGGEKSEFHSVVTWDRLAEICNQYLTKGQLVYIEGSLQNREWDDQDGNKRKTTEVRARDMVMLGGKGEGAGGGQRRVAAAEGSAGSSTSSVNSPGTSTITDDDIPF